MGNVYHPGIVSFWLIHTASNFPESMDALEAAFERAFKLGQPSSRHSGAIGLQMHPSKDAALVF